MEYAPTSHNRTVYAAPAVAGLQKRHIQPERYAKCSLKLVGSLKKLKNELTKNELYFIIIEWILKN
jgi:hypothetical protein